MSLASGCLFHAEPNLKRHVSRLDHCGFECDISLEEIVAVEFHRRYAIGLHRQRISKFTFLKGHLETEVAEISADHCPAAFQLSQKLK
jgi:hypothetical protein